LKITFFYLCNRIITITITISVVNRKELEPQFLILAPAPGSNLILAPRLLAPALAPQHWMNRKRLGNRLKVNEMMCFIPFIVSSTRRGEICQGQHIPDKTNKFTYYLSKIIIKKVHEQLATQRIKKNACSENCPWSKSFFHGLIMEVEDAVWLR
jgi:hypothetical protein